MNKAYKYIVLGAVLFVCLQGCAVDSQQSSGRRVFVDIPQERTGYCDSLFGPARILFLETTPESLLNSLSKVILKDDLLFVLDAKSNKICVFDTTGKYQWNINRQGRGPGEYVGLLDFVINDPHDEIVLYAHRPHKLIYLDRQGNFKREVNLPDGLYYEVGLYAGKFVCVNCELYDPEYYVSLLNLQDGKEEVKLPLVQHLPYDTFAGERQMIQSKRLNFTCRYDNTIYQFCDSSSFFPWIELDFGRNNFPSGLLDQQLTADQLQDLIYHQRVVYSIVNVTASDQTLCFATNLTGFGRVDLSTMKADFFTKAADRTHQVVLGRVLSLESVHAPRVAFQQSVQQLKLFAEVFAQDMPVDLKERIVSLQEDDNPVLFLYPLR